MQPTDLGLALVWQAFVAEGRLDSSELNPVIAQSWERSLEYGVNPHRIDKNDVLESHLLKQRLQAVQGLLDSAAGAMDTLYQTLKGLGFTVLLSDYDGYIVKTIGDPDFLDKASQICLSAGANWSETIKGTNAIGMALRDKKPVSVFAWEHFCQENHFLACSAAPILGPQGELLGALDVSGDRRGGNERLNNMVAMAAKNIEKDILLRDLMGKYKVSKRKSEVITEVVSEGLISISKEGLIKDINPVAANLLGYKQRECLDKPVAEVLTGRQVWSFNTADFEGEVSVRGHQEKRLLARGHSVFDEDGNHQGTVATLKPLANPAKELRAGIRYSFDRIIGSSEALYKAISRAQKAAAKQSTILIHGETGTGKELFAQSIHQQSSHRDGSFIAINCAAIPRELVESELFGYEEGAFTGAKRGGAIGKFEAANGGSIFLDEIGDMPLTAQTALLRVLQEKQITRVGGQKVIPVDVRVIAATHCSLEKAVAEKTFRQDLYYRLNVVDIHIPPLRERGDDILILANFFLQKFSVDGTEFFLSPEAVRLLTAYSWPGNIRELENTIEGLTNLADGPEILPEHFPDRIRAAVAVQNAPDNEHGPQCSLSLLPGRGAVPLREAERMAIIRALDTCRGNISLTAQVLGIGRNTLHRKLKEFEIRVS